MIVLSDTTKKLQIVLGAAITTNQLPVYAAFRDITTSTYTADNQLSTSNSTTDVDIVSAPAASTKRVVDHINVYNADTVAVNVTIKIDNAGADSILVKRRLNTGESLTYNDGSGWTVVASADPPLREYILHANAAGALTLTDATNAERFANNSTRPLTTVNFGGYTQVRFMVHVMTASASVNTPKLRLRYCSFFTTTFANYLQLGASTHVDVSLFTGTAGTKQDTGWIDLAAGAQQDEIILALCELGGDAAADPAVGFIQVWVR